jgi:aspartokinase
MSVVMKFGGTSVADPDAINRLIGIVRQQQAKTKNTPVVVVSALAKVTDSLVAIAQLAEDGASDKAAAEVRPARPAPRGGGGSHQHQPREGARGREAGVRRG